jgi:hypothetical protein
MLMLLFLQVELVENRRLEILCVLDALGRIVVVIIYPTRAPSKGIMI